MNSETVSEMPRRGRPPKYGARDYKYAKECGPMARTKRAQQNVINRLYGIGTIQAAIEEGDEALRWLLDPERCQAGQGGMRSGILAELGRIEDADVMLSIARQIAELKPRAHDAVAMIRGTRLSWKEAL